MSEPTEEQILQRKLRLLADKERRIRGRVKERYAEKVEPLRVKLAAAEKAVEDEFAPEYDAIEAEDAPLRKRLAEIETEQMTAKQLASLKLKVGDPMIEWKHRGDPRWPQGPMYPTGSRGVVEVFNWETSKRPAHFDHNVKNGSVVVRVLKKNGQPSVGFFRLPAWDWHPEGVDPNKDGRG